MRWKQWETDYLTNHAGDGAEAIARKLGRTKRAVEVMASRTGVSLRRSWHCPRCGRDVYTPLSQWSGWCRRCSVNESKDGAAIKNREVRKQIAQERRSVQQAERERQAIYEDTRRKKNELRKLRESREVNEKWEGAEDEKPKK